MNPNKINQNKSLKKAYKQLMFSHLQEHPIDKIKLRKSNKPWISQNKLSYDPCGESPGKNIVEVIGGECSTIKLNPIREKGDSLMQILGQFDVSELGTVQLSTIRIGMENFNLSSTHLASIRLFKYNERTDSFESITRSGISVNRTIFFGVIHEQGKYVIAGLPRDEATLTLMKIKSELNRLKPIFGEKYFDPIMGNFCHQILCPPAPFAKRLLDLPLLKSIGLGDDLGDDFSHLDGLEIPRNEKGKPDGLLPRPFPRPLPIPERESINLCDRCHVPATINPPIIYTDIDQFWEFRGPKNISGRMKCIITHPIYPRIMLAGSAGAGVWKSENGGSYWRPTMFNKISMSIGYIAFSESDPNFAIAGAGEYVGGSKIQSVFNGGMVYHSVDQGNSWQEFGNQDSFSCSKVLIDPQDSSLIYVAGESGICRWDSGQNSKKLIYYGNVSDMIFDPFDSNIIIAAVDFETNGIIRTTNAKSNTSSTQNAGVTWHPYDRGITWPSGSIQFTKLHFAGSTLFATTNAIDSTQQITMFQLKGNIWEKQNNIDTTTLNFWSHFLEISEENPNIMMVGGQRLYRSTDAGQTWDRMFGGHVDYHAGIILKNQQGKFGAYVANDGGIFYCTDIEALEPKFVSFNTRLNTAQLYNVSVAQSIPFLVGGSTQDNGVIFSKDGKFFEGVPSANEGGLFEIDPNDSDRIMLDPSGGDVRLFNLNIPTRTDDMKKGIEFSIGDVYKLIFNKSSSDHILCAFFDEEGGASHLYFTIEGTSGIKNNGWIKSEVELEGLQVYSIRMAPSNGHTIYVGTENKGILKSLNGGISYTKTSNSSLPNGKIISLDVDVQDPKMVYALLSEGKNGEILFKSIDGGVSWRSISGSGSNRLPLAEYNTVLAHRHNKDMLFVSNLREIFKTEDGGLTWEAFSGKLPRTYISDMEFNDKGNELFISTLGWGIWSRKLYKKRVFDFQEIDLTNIEINVKKIKWLPL